MKDPATKIPSVATEIQDSQVNKSLEKEPRSASAPVTCPSTPTWPSVPLRPTEADAWAGLPTVIPCLLLPVLGLHCLFHRLSSCMEWGYAPVPGRGLWCRAGDMVFSSLACALSCCSSRAPENRCSRFGSWAELLCSMWNLPQTRYQTPLSPALAGRF